MTGRARCQVARHDGNPCGRPCVHGRIYCATHAFDDSVQLELAPPKPEKRVQHCVACQRPAHKKLSRTGRCERCAWARSGSAVRWEADEVAQSFVADNPAGATLEKVGETLGLTRERVRQIEQTALRWFRIGCLFESVSREDVRTFLEARARQQHDGALFVGTRTSHAALEAWVRRRVLASVRTGQVCRQTPDAVAESIVGEWDAMHGATELDASMEPAESTVALRGEVDALASRAAWVRDVARVAQACAIAEWIRERRAGAEEAAE